VLDAALAIAAEGGFDAASMAAIAARAGVAKAVLYDCFPGGKRELWAALLARLERDFSRHLAGIGARVRSAPRGQGVAAGLTAFLDYVDTNPDAFRVVFGEAGSAHPEIRRGAERVRERFVTAVRDELVAAAGLPPSAVVGAELFARMITATAEELARWTLRRPDLDRDVLVSLAAGWLRPSAR
jgi:AcrR family transcriptional regulator